MKKDIKGYEGLYWVTSDGEIWSYDREYIMPRHNITLLRKSRKLKPCAFGKYLGIALFKNKKFKKSYIHKIVASAFLDKKNEKDIVNHIDGNKFNNNIKNLEWVSYSENGKHARDNGLRPMNKISMSVAIEIRTLYKNGAVQTDLAKKYNVSQSVISSIVLNKIWIPLQK